MFARNTIMSAISAIIRHSRPHIVTVQEMYTVKIYASECLTVLYCTVLENRPNYYRYSGNMKRQGY